VSIEAPESYEQLFDEYFNYTVGLVKKLGIDPQRAEDVASSIILRFYERDFLSKFDPTLVFDYKGSKRPARFKSFLNAFVSVYCRHYRQRQNIEKSREPLICE